MIVLFWGMIILATVAAFFGIWRLNQKHVFFERGLRQVIRIYDRRGISSPAWFIRWSAWLEASPIERAFHAINRSLRWLGADIPPHLTPRERAKMLIALLPEEQETIMQLLNEHEKIIFTPSGGDIETAQRASKKITWAGLKRTMKKHSEKTGL